MSAEKEKVIAPMLKEVLSWDIRHLEPQKDKLTKVPHYFADVASYIEVFEPLIYEETRAQIARSLTDSDAAEETGAPGLSRVRYLGDVGDFCVAGLSVSDETMMSSFRDNDLLVLSAVHPESMFSDKDLERIEQRDGENTEAQEDNAEDEAERHLHLVGIVENIEPGGVRAKFFLKKNDERIKTMGRLLNFDREWWIMKLTTLSTLIREFTSLHSASKYPLIDAIITGDCESKDKDVIMKIPGPLQAQFEATYNPSQMEALKSALSGDKITLIQGPPGTGKTTVISGVLSVLLHSKEVPIAQKPVAKRFKPTVLTPVEKHENWDMASPWLNGEPSYMDDFSEIDFTYEATMEKKRRIAKLRPNIPESLFDNSSVQKRILLCAPSNGAVDEIVLRIMREGLLNGEGERYTPALVRVGPGAHRDVEEVTLEGQAKARITAAGGAAAPSAMGFHQVWKKKMPLDPKTIRSVILGNASIVATTLSFSGSNLLDQIPQFDYVIIDEAAQAVETSTLVALKHQAKSLVLVGDPKQLPATIISKVALQYGYDQSLFQRLMYSNVKLSLLRTQYRMHPAIRHFPSSHFYASQLEDAESVVGGNRVQPYHNTPCFGPFVFYDIRHSVEAVSPGNSYYNEEEAKAVVALYRLLLQTHPEITDMASRVGVISPYKHQVTMLRQMFKEFPGVNVDTVDGYQGREREIIFFSCVRAPPKGKKATIGFLSDVRRMNVALTRPRSSLIVVGNSRALKSNVDWRALVSHAVDSKCYVRVEKKDEFIPQLIDAAVWEAQVTRSLEESHLSALKRQNAIEKNAEKKTKKNKGKKGDDANNDETNTDNTEVATLDRGEECGNNDENNNDNNNNNNDNNTTNVNNSEP